MILKTLPFTETWLDYPDNESLSVLVQVLGCDHKCLNCSNPKLQDFSGEGLDKGSSLISYISWNAPGFFYSALENKCKSLKTNKVVIGGGDPLYKENLPFIKSFLEWHGNKFDICLYTGHDINYVIDNKIQGFTYIKCGVYNEKLKQKSEKKDNYMQWGSKNQELYNEYFDLLSHEGRYYYLNEEEE